MSRPKGRAHHRGQSGISLVELLLVVLLTGMLFGPLTAWWLLAERTQPQIQTDAGRIASVALLSQYLVRDIAVAAEAANSDDMTEDLAFNFEDCKFGDGEGGDVKLVLLRGGLATGATKTVYTEVESDGVATLWRRTCNSQSGESTIGIQVADGLAPGSTTASCTSDTSSQCRTIEFKTTPTDRDPVLIRGKRRVDVAVDGSQAAGTRSPIAKITVASTPPPQLAERPYSASFSAETSYDPDGELRCFQWTFTTQAEDPLNSPREYVTIDRDELAINSVCPERNLPPGSEDPTVPDGDQARTFATSGVYYVELTVTDATGLSATDYLRFEIEPRNPIAEARVTPPDTGVAGETLFTFEARWDDDPEAEGPLVGSRHPDGEISSYEWTLAQDDDPEVTGDEVVLQAIRNDFGPWSVALPEEMVGNVTVTLTVRDTAQNRQGTYVTGLVLSAPAEGATLPPTTTWPLGIHTRPGGARLGTAPGDLGRFLWNAAPQVTRYVVETDRGCGSGSFRVVQPPALSAPLLPPGCLNPTNPLRMRVAAEFGGALSTWSDWVTYTVPVQRVNPPPQEGGS